MERPILKPKWEAPDWRDPTAYGDVKSWSERRWAWEFLRRNKEYQKIAKVSGPPGAQPEMGRKFGRTKIKAYWSEYSKEEERGNVWLVDRVVAEHGWEGYSSKPQTPLLATEMAIKMDLSIIMASGEAALNILMEKIKHIVTEEMGDRWGEDGFPERPIRRPSETDLFLYLRLFDAGRASSNELAPYLYPEYCKRLKASDNKLVADTDLVTAGASNISRQRKKGEANGRTRLPNSRPDCPIASKCVANRVAGVFCPIKFRISF